MKNKKAIKLIDEILENIEKTGINTDELIKNIKELRSYALEEELPLVVKVLRYTYEHIEEHNSFLIPILDDEPIDESVSIEKQEDTSPEDSLKYLISLLKNLKNKTNISDLKEYKNLLINY